MVEQETRNMVVTVSKEHVQDAKAIARLVGVDYKQVLAAALARGVEAAMADVRSAAGGGE